METLVVQQPKSIIVKPSTASYLYVHHEFTVIVSACLLYLRYRGASLLFLGFHLFLRFYTSKMTLLHDLSIFWDMVKFELNLLVAQASDVLFYF